MASEKPPPRRGGIPKICDFRWAVREAGPYVRYRTISEIVGDGVLDVPPAPTGRVSENLRFSVGRPGGRPLRPDFDMVPFRRSTATIDDSSCMAKKGPDHSIRAFFVYSPTALLVSMVWISFRADGFPMRVALPPRRRTRGWDLSEAIHVGRTPAWLGLPVRAQLHR